jgi:antigen flippase
LKSNNTYKQIVKSTGIIGGGQILTILIGIVRTKIIAIIIGPTGIGYSGILQSIIDLVRGFTGLGINFSGVKKIANSAKDDFELSKAAIILNKWSLWTGIIGTIFTALFCVQLSNFTFGNKSESQNIAIISVSILIISISSGQIAYLQGIRQIKIMAKATLFGALLGSSLTIPLYYIWGVKGVVPGIIVTSLGNILISNWYVNKFKINKIILKPNYIFKEGLDMIKLGFFITLSGFLSTLTLYFIRAFLLKKMNLDAVGTFQACWMISNLYLGIILNSMLADFFPRLSEIHDNNVLSNRLINEQLEITYLISTPIIIGIIVFSKFLMHMFYSKSFLIGLPILQWQIAGSFFIIMSWPLGVLFLAKNKGIYSLVTDLFKLLIFIAVVIVGWKKFGIIILGVAYAISNLIGVFAIYYCTNKLSNFKYSSINIKYSIFLGIAVFLALINVILMNGLIKIVISMIILLTVIYISYKRLSKMINLNEIIYSKILAIKKN